MSAGLLASTELEARAQIEAAGCTPSTRSARVSRPRRGFDRAALGAGLPTPPWVRPEVSLNQRESLTSETFALGAGLPTPPWVRPEVSLNQRESLTSETFGPRSCEVGDLVNSTQVCEISARPVPAGSQLVGYQGQQDVSHSVGPVPAGARLAGYVRANSIVAPAGTGPTESRKCSGKVFRSVLV